jgi:hypothetical protein
MSNGLRTFVTTNGYAIQYRTLPPDYLPALRARVRREHESTKPAAPTVRVETAPDVWAEQPVSAEGELPADPALAVQVTAYREALAAWERGVTIAITREMRGILLRTLRFEVDAELVRELRELYTLAGEDLSDDDDRAVMLWRAILVDPGDQAAVASSLQGISVEEAAARARAMFRSAMGGAAA